MGYNYGDLGERDSSEVYFKKALLLVPPTDKYMLSAIFHDRGYVAMISGDHQDAIHLFQEALGFLPNNNNYSNKRQDILKNLASVYHAVGETEKYNETQAQLHKLTENIDAQNSKALGNQLTNAEKKINENQS